VFVAFCLGLRTQPDLFEFLGDKFEQKWYWWEMMLVGRKIGLMASFLFFAETPVRATSGRLSAISVFL
jgi:hypothetical protein